MKPSEYVEIAACLETLRNVDARYKTVGRPSSEVSQMRAAIAALESIYAETA